MMTRIMKALEETFHAEDIANMAEVTARTVQKYSEALIEAGLAKRSGRAAFVISTSPY